jgi:hypothetical protein
MAFDAAQNVYVVDANGIDAFAPELITKLGTMPYAEIANTMACDNQGILYVDGESDVREFVPWRSSALRTIKVDHSSTLALDHQSRLYVANFARRSPRFWIAEYEPGDTTPFRRITKGLVGPQKLTFDGRGNLFVLSRWSPIVLVYAYGVSSPARKIRDGIVDPTDMAVQP